MYLRSLEGMTAVVTGASSGIGEAAAQALAQEGANVVLTACSASKIGILISLIEPGAMYSDWGYGYAEDQLKERRDNLQAMRPDDIANALIFALAQPPSINLQELLIMPTRQTMP